MLSKEDVTVPVLWLLMYDTSLSKKSERRSTDGGSIVWAEEENCRRGSFEKGASKIIAFKKGQERAGEALPLQPAEEAARSLANRV